MFKLVQDYLFSKNGENYRFGIYNGRNATVVAKNYARDFLVTQTISVKRTLYWGKDI